MTLRAKETFFVGDRKVSRGQLVNEKDPLIRPGLMGFFEIVAESVPFLEPIEQATAAPGERRNVPRRGRPPRQKE